MAMNRWLTTLIVCMTLLSAANLLYLVGVVGAIIGIVVGVVSLLIAKHRSTETFIYE